MACAAVLASLLTSPLAACLSFLTQKRFLVVSCTQGRCVRWGALQGDWLEGLKASSPSLPLHFWPDLGQAALLAGQVQEYVAKSSCFPPWPPLKAMEQMTRKLGSRRLCSLPRASNPRLSLPRTRPDWTEGTQSRGFGQAVTSLLRPRLGIVRGFLVL